MVQISVSLYIWNDNIRLSVGSLGGLSALIKNALTFILTSHKSSLKLYGRIFASNSKKIRSKSQFWYKVSIHDIKLYAFNPRLFNTLYQFSGITDGIIWTVLGSMKRFGCARTSIGWMCSESICYKFHQEVNCDNELHSNINFMLENDFVVV